MEERVRSRRAVIPAAGVPFGKRAADDLVHCPMDQAPPRASPARAVAIQAQDAGGRGAWVPVVQLGVPLCARLVANHSQRRAHALRRTVGACTPLGDCPPARVPTGSLDCVGGGSPGPEHT
jgi:hypothetical protein